MLNTTGLPLTFAQRTSGVCCHHGHVERLLADDDNQLPAPVWMASADNCSGAMVVYSCCWLFWAGTSAAGFLTWGTSMTWASFTMPSDAFFSSLGRFHGNLFLRGDYRRTGIDDSFHLFLFFLLFFYRSFGSGGAQCFCCSQAKVINEVYGFSAPLGKSAYQFGLRLVQGILCLQSTPRRYIFLFLSR